MSNTCWVVLWFSFSSPCVTLCCPFLIAPSVFSNFNSKPAINKRYIENRGSNEEWTIERHRQYWVQDTERRHRKSTTQKIKHGPHQHISYMYIDKYFIDFSYNCITY